MLILIVLVKSLTALTLGCNRGRSTPPLQTGLALPFGQTHLINTAIPGPGSELTTSIPHTRSTDRLLQYSPRHRILNLYPALNGAYERRPDNQGGGGQARFSGCHLRDTYLVLAIRSPIQARLWDPRYRCNNLLDPDLHLRLPLRPVDGLRSLHSHQDS